MHKILISLFGLVLLFGGVALYSNVAMASGGGAEEEEGGGDKFRFVELDPLVLPIVDNNGVSQTVNMVVALEVKSEGDVSKIELYKPKLVDAYLQDLYGVLNEHAALKGGVIQLGIVKKRLLAISNEILGEDVVQAVLLQVVSQRRL